MSVATIPQAVVMKAIQREGRSFLITRLEGILIRDQSVISGVCEWP